MGNKYIKFAISMVALEGVALFWTLGYINFALLDFFASAFVIGKYFSLDRKQREEQEIEFVVKPNVEPEKKVSFVEKKQEQETIPYETKKTEIRQSFPTFEMDDPIVPFLQSSNVGLNTPFQSAEKKKAESTIQAYDFSFDGFEEFDETVLSFFADENKKRK